MQQRHITWATWAAGFAFFAAADTALGTGAVQALADLCISDAAYVPQTPGMPMEHSGHVMPWLIAGTHLVSFAGFASWRLTNRANRSAWAPRRRPILAGLAHVALAQKKITAADLAEAWNAALDPDITETDATIALGRFGDMSPAGRRELMAGLREEIDRAALVCMALRLLRQHGDPTGDGRAALELLADDIGMTGLEIFAHWDAAEAPSRASVAVGEARALSAIAAQTILSRGLRAAAQLEAPARAIAGMAWTATRRLARAALVAFVRALSSPQPKRSDDQLTGLRRQFRRRGLSTRLSSLPIAPSMMPKRSMS